MSRAAALAYTENDAATAVSPRITVSDLDWLTDPVLDSATVTISSGLREGDVLAYPGELSGVTATYAASSGVMSLTGRVSVSEWQTALRSVTYSSWSEDPTGTQVASDRTVTFVISDGNVSSAAVSRTVVVTPVNDIPVLANIENTTMTTSTFLNISSATVFGTETAVTTIVT